eukprot:7391208-Prymnesium_polylepis.2
MSGCDRTRWERPQTGGRSAHQLHAGVCGGPCSSWQPHGCGSTGDGAGSITVEESFHALSHLVWLPGRGVGAPEHCLDDESLRRKY